MSSDVELWCFKLLMFSDTELFEGLVQTQTVEFESCHKRFSLFCVAQRSERAELCALNHLLISRESGKADSRRMCFVHYA